MARGHCITGGTFTCVHEGHGRILRECRKFQRVSLGLTSDSFVKKHKIYPSLPFEKRLAGLKKALAKHGILSRTTVMKIEDEAGGADGIADADAIIVSEETEEAARRINAKRVRRSFSPLKIISVPLAYGEDLKKLSCGSICAGKTGAKGNLRTPLLVSFGTENPTKLLGARRALGRIFGRKFRVIGNKVPTGVADHPFNGETFRGAKNRAHAAWKKISGKCDYAIGMESGLFTLQKGMHIDITVACVYDGKEETYGTGMGFVVPEEIAQSIRKKGGDLSKALEKLAGIRRIGRKHGAIGHFSAGVLHRSEQVEQSILCAFVPRIARARVGLGY